MRAVRLTKGSGRLLPVVIGAASLMLLGGCGTAQGAKVHLTIKVEKELELDELKVSVHWQEEDVGKPSFFDFSPREGEREGHVMILLPDDLIGQEITVRVEALLGGVCQGVVEASITIDEEGLNQVTIWLRMVTNDPCRLD